MRQLPLERGAPAPKAIAVWRSSAPFVINERAVLVHRPRSVATYQISRAPHLGVHMLCGSAQVGGGNFSFVDDVPTDKLLCARCEDQARRTDRPSADELCGRHVHVGGVKAQRQCCGGEE